MIAVAAVYTVAGAVLGAWILYVLTPSASKEVTEAPTPTPAVLPPLPSSVKPPIAGLPVLVPPLHYDLAHAILPDPKLTSGDTVPGATAADVCTPGWASEHRHVTEGMRDQVYTEYGRTRGPDCCEVDHLIPLELGGSNDMKNLWPEPSAPQPGYHEKDQLENELHAMVCSGKISLADAQNCISTNWVKCWQQYAQPLYAGGAH